LQTSSRSLLTQTKHDSTISETYLPVSTLTTKPIQASSIATAASDAIVAMLVIYLLIVKGRGKKETGHGKYLELNEQCRYLTRRSITVFKPNTKKADQSQEHVEE
jgi:hypothetical protein